MINILENPRGIAYKDLVDLASRKCAKFSLVFRDFVETTQADKIHELLRADFIKEELTEVWPGTRLLGHKALIRYYRISNNSINIIKSSVKSLYGWLGPRYPEDLAFYAPDGKCWLGSIAHEKDGFIYESKEYIENNVRNIKVKDSDTNGDV